MTKNITKKDMAIRHGIQQQDVIARFNSKLVAKKNGCIELNTFAYDPRDRYRGFTIMYPNQNKEYVQATVKAHRFAYALHYGFDALPESDNFNAESKCINHICGNTRCVNPEHLNVMTVTENSIYRAPKDNMITMSMVNAKTCSKCRDRTKNNNPFYGKSHTEKTKSILREKMSGENSWIKNINPSELSYTKQYIIEFVDGSFKEVHGLKAIAEEFNTSIANLHATIQRMQQGKIPKRGIFKGININEK
jgi:hypothetical protein